MSTSEHDGRASACLRLKALIWHEPPYPAHRYWRGEIWGSDAFHGEPEDHCDGWSSRSFWYLRRGAASASYCIAWAGSSLSNRGTFAIIILLLYSTWGLLSMWTTGCAGGHGCADTLLPSQDCDAFFWFRHLREVQDLHLRPCHSTTLNAMTVKALEKQF